jgi:hypothetical protein
MKGKVFPRAVLVSGLCLLLAVAASASGYPLVPSSYENEAAATVTEPEAVPGSKSSAPQGWQMGTSIPQGTDKPEFWAHCGSAVSGGLLWLFGGRTDADWERLDRVGTYDPHTGVWQLDYPPLGIPRANLAGAGNEESIFALGGTDEFILEIEDASEVLAAGNPVSWAPMVSLPDKRSEGAAVIDGKSLFYIGGTKSSTEDPDVIDVIEEDNLWRYDIISGTWTTGLRKAPVGLAFISAAVVKGKIYVPGNATSANTYVYDINSNSWSVIPPSGGISPAFYYQCVAVGDQVWRIGGLIPSQEGFAITNEVWVLDPTTGQWSRHPSPLNVPRMSFAAGIIGTRVVVAGGIKEIETPGEGEEVGEFVPTNTTEFLELSDADSDGIPDLVEEASCTDPLDADTDDDGIPDGVEDANRNGSIDPSETDPCNPDTDGDGLQDGTEGGYTLAMAGPGTDLSKFQPDLDPSTKTDPLSSDTDGDGLTDGQEDADRNGRLDPGEFDPMTGSVLFVAEGGACGGKTPCLQRIQDAINSANTHFLIKIRDGYFNEQLSISQGKQITLSGGYGSGFLSNPGETIVPSITSRGGLAVFDKITIGPNPK